MTDHSGGIGTQACSRPSRQEALFSRYLTRRHGITQVSEDCGHDALEHIEGRLHMCNVIEVGSDLVARGRSRVYSHLPHVVQEHHCVTDLAVKRRKQITVGALNRQPLFLDGQLNQRSKS